MFESFIFTYLHIVHFVFYSCLCECMILLHDFKWLNKTVTYLNVFELHLSPVW